MDIFEILQKYYKNITEMLQKLNECAIIIVYSKEKVKKMELMTIIYILLFLIFGLILYAVMQLKLAGLNVKDFWSFIEANQMLDKLYAFSKKYQKMSPQEQIIFLMEAEKVFTAFDKVPKMIWEEEYDKYTDVLNTYKDIKVLRWVSN